MALIDVQNASFSYDGVSVLKDINFEVNKGDFLCILGENGSGKSTLLKGILCLKSSDSGKIAFNGFKKNEIGYLSQSTAVQKDFPASVWEVVLSGTLSASKFPFYSRQQKKRARDNIERLGITDLKQRCFRELSGGQQQRVLLARSLCAAEKLLVMDEPVAGLDPKVTQDMYEVIDELNKKEGMTIIVVSHDVLKSTEYANKILHLENEQLFFGDTESYKLSNVGKEYMKRG